MKQLTCEMCGSTDLIKQDGLYVCQSCGVKYSVEEAKKMMIEGTVKIDNSEKLNNLYTLARQAKESNDDENAVKYYDLIKQEDPSSWEASFYNVYFRATQTRIMYIQSAANSINNCLEIVFNLIKNSAESNVEKKAHVLEVASRVENICKLLEKSAKSTFVDLFNNAFGQFSGSGDRVTEYTIEYGERALASADAMITCGNYIERDYRSDNELMKKACVLWKSAVNIWKNCYAIYDNHAVSYAKMKNSTVAKIKKYDNKYVFSAPNYPGFPNAYVNIIGRASDIDFYRG